MVLEAPENSAANRYIGKMTFDGAAYDRNYVRYSDLMKGATLHFDMQDEPDMRRGTDPSSWPFSMSTAAAE